MAIMINISNILPPFQPTAEIPQAQEKPLEGAVHEDDAKDVQQIINHSFRYCKPFC